MKRARGTDSDVVRIGSDLGRLVVGLMTGRTE